MDYNQQRRSRGGYGYRRSMNPGCGCPSANPGCGGQPSPAHSDCGCPSANPGCDCQPSPAGSGYNRPSRPSDCGCMRPVTAGIDSFEIAMAYVPWQTWKGTYDPHRSLMSGTIFPELDKPFCAAGRCKR